MRSLAAVCAKRGRCGAATQLGARRVEVTGNLKFDVALDDAQLKRGREWKSRVAGVLLLASTRDGEEQLLLDAIGDADFLTIVVPRHPQRFAEVASLAHARKSATPVPAPTHRILLGDTMGEMAFYGAADVAIIGGSFMPLGGQNLMKRSRPAFLSLLGPSMYNFAEATRLALEAGAAVQAPDAAAGVREAVALLADAPRRAAMAAAGKRLCLAHRGATARHLAILSSKLH